MNKFIATLLIVAVAFNSATAFTTQCAASLTTRKQSVGPTFEMPSAAASTTALQLKGKVDPDAKGNNNAAGNAKMAAYGGSIIFAALLPIAFLVWSAVSK